MTVPMLANSVGYDVALLGTPAAAALEKMLYVASPMAGPDSDAAGVKTFIADYEKKYPSSKPSSATLQAPH